MLVFAKVGLVPYLICAGITEHPVASPTAQWWCKDQQLQGGDGGTGPCQQPIC